MAVSYTGLNEAQSFVSGLSKYTSSALSQTLNELAEQAKDNAKKSILDDLNLTKSYIDQRLEVVKSTSKSLNAKVRSESRGISLSNFDAKQLFTGVRRSGISVRVKKRTVNMKKAFMFTGKNGNKVVAVRTGKARNDIKALYGPSVSQALGVITDPLSEKASDSFFSTFDKNLQKAINA